MNSSFRSRCFAVSACLVVWSASYGDLTDVRLKAEYGGPVELSTGQCVYPLVLYATFNHPDDRLLSTGLADISLQSGAFYQNPFGGDTPPSSVVTDFAPDARYDSFVTIGALEDAPWVSTDGNFDSDLFAAGDALFGGWFNSNPKNGMGDAGVYENFTLPMAQFTVVGGAVLSDISGDMTVFWKAGDTGDIFGTDVAVFIPLIGLDPFLCPADLDGNGTVGAADLAILLAAWGELPRCGSDWPDINNDGVVGPGDLAIVLGTWGPC